MSGKVAIVTGAGSGIGRATAVMLGQRGFSVVLAGRRREALAATAELVQGEAMMLPADVGTEEGARSIVRGALEAFGRLDAIVNNAASAPSKPVNHFRWAELEALYRVNTIGPHAVIAEAWHAMAGQHAADGSISRIVNVSSVSAIDPYQGLSAYGASKAALHALTQGCAGEGRECGIRAFVVAPGAVETGMLRSIFSEEVLPRSSTLRPEEVAAVIVACAAGERDEENGGVIVVPSGGGEG